MVIQSRQATDEYSAPTLDPLASPRQINANSTVTELEKFLGGVTLSDDGTEVCGENSICTYVIPAHPMPPHPIPPLHPPFLWPREVDAMVLTI